MSLRRPDRASLRPGGKFGRHAVEPRHHDQEILSLVEVLFAPTDKAYEPLDRALVRQLLDYAPRPDQLGVKDWDRKLRADEVAAVHGQEYTISRDAWLRRADEACRAWGRPLLGEGGLVEEYGLDPA